MEPGKEAIFDDPPPEISFQIYPVQTEVSTVFRIDECPDNMNTISFAENFDSYHQSVCHPNANLLQPPAAIDNHNNPNDNCFYNFESVIPIEKTKSAIEIVHIDNSYPACYESVHDYPCNTTTTNKAYHCNISSFQTDLLNDNVANSSKTIVNINSLPNDANKKSHTDDNSNNHRKKSNKITRNFKLYDCRFCCKTFLRHSNLEQHLLKQECWLPEDPRFVPPRGTNFAKGG